MLGRHNYVTRTFILAVTCLCNAACTSSSYPKGHLQPFGCHNDPSIITPELHTVPQPEEFFTTYEMQRQPAVLRGAAKKSPAFREWTQSTLADKYGHEIVRLEARAEGDRTTPVTESGFGRDNLRHFVQNYNNMNAYVISQVPRAMEKDISIPPCLRCGFFDNRIQDVHMFMTAKGGKTLLHRDPYSNIHCVFNGTKDWILVDNRNDRYVYQSKSSEDEFGGYSTIDVDEVDLDKYPNIRLVNFSKVAVNAGDCIYIPGSYWHQVRVKGEFNAAVSIWFTRYFPSLPHDWTTCSHTCFDFQSMANTALVWRDSYDDDDMHQGHMDIHILRLVLLTYADSDGLIDVHRFCNETIKELNGNSKEQLHKKFTSLLTVGDTLEKIAQETIEKLSNEKLKDLLLVIDPIDPSNTPDYEYSEIQPDRIRKIIFDLLRSSHGNISFEAFEEKYVDIGGSKRVAAEIFSGISLDSERITWRNWQTEQAMKTLRKFTSAVAHDPTIERLWHRRLRQVGEL